MTKKQMTVTELESLNWEEEAKLLNEAVDCGLLSPADWNDGNFDIVEIAQELNIEIIE